ncbi:MAG: hypothetical protein RIS76_621 [Verrucomicrobiota bacterium]|jgi:hypothetical protein
MNLFQKSVLAAMSLVAVTAQGQAVIVNIDEDSATRLKLTGIWDTSVANTVALTEGNFSRALGHWNLTANFGLPAYTMEFFGSHKGAPQVTATLAGFPTISPGPLPRTANHGVDNDVWSFSASHDPANAQRILWTVTAEHDFTQVPEPSGVAAIAAGSLLLFGVARRARPGTPKTNANGVGI